MSDTEAVLTLSFWPDGRVFADMKDGTEKDSRGRSGPFAPKHIHAYACIYNIHDVAFDRCKRCGLLRKVETDEYDR